MALARFFSVTSAIHVNDSTFSKGVKLRRKDCLVIVVIRALIKSGRLALICSGSVVKIYSPVESLTDRRRSRPTCLFLPKSVEGDRIPIGPALLFKYFSCWMVSEPSDLLHIVHTQVSTAGISETCNE